MKPSELEAAIIETLDVSEVSVRDMTDNGGWGLVWYELLALGEDTQYVVHRWAVKDTAGRDIPFRLYSGYYAEEEADARDEYRYREDSNRVIA